MLRHVGVSARAGQRDLRHVTAMRTSTSILRLESHAHSRGPWHHRLCQADLLLAFLSDR